MFYGIYILFLQKETFFSINRYYLLGALGAGLMIPLIGGYLPANQTSTEVYQVLSNVSSLEITPLETHHTTFFSWINLLCSIYAIGAFIVFSKFVYGLSKIYTIYRDASITKYQKYTLVESSKYHLPFSFFHFIFISKVLPLNKDAEKVLKHEELHACQWHSLDIVITEILQVFFWFNPILIFYKVALKQSHEFLADAYVTKDFNKSSYGQLLLRQSTSGLEIALANHFFQSQLKNRITMMYKEKSKRPAMVKYLVALPVLVAMLFIFSSSQNFKNAEDSQATIKPSTETLLNAPETESQGDPIFKVVEEMPRFPGCEEDQFSLNEKENCAKGKLFQFIYENIKYPSEAKKANIEGMTVVQFVVEKDGTISNGKIIRDIGGGCGDESLKAIQSMPKWVPGRQRGNTVRVQYTLPVKFKLDSKITTQERQEEIPRKTSAALKEKSVIPHTPGLESEDIHNIVEEMPRFPGCEDDQATMKEKDECAKSKLLEFIYANIKYPSDAKDQGIEGVAIVQMVIETDGSVSSSKIVRDPGAGTGEEAIRVVDLMPKWIPGKQKGKNVKVQYTLPIKYKLEGEEKTLQKELKEEIKSEKISPKALEVQHLTINPNPSNGIFTLTFDLKDKVAADLIFYSMNGQQIRSFNKVSLPFSKSIDLSDYRGQVIFLKIIQNGKVYSEKITII
jgi:TonB family protein